MNTHIKSTQLTGVSDIYIYGLLLSAIAITLSFIYFFNVYIFRIPKNKLLSLQLHVGPTKSELPEKKKKTQYFKSTIQAWVLLLISPSQWSCKSLNSSEYAPLFIMIVMLYKHILEVVYLCSITQSRPTLCDPMDSSLTSYSIHGIFQARILEWVARGGPNINGQNSEA